MKYLVLSDIHLGHNINKTENIINNLDFFFKDYKEYIISCDYIFLAGDVFDKLLLTSGIDFLESSIWLTNLVTFCNKFKIKLRILEGTSSHDWKQSSVVYSIISNFDNVVDFKYIDTLYIENDNGFTILYVPDEYNSDSQDTYKEITKLMTEQGLEKIDIAIMHGSFNYQLPNIKLKSSFNENDFLSIIKYYINIGHIHKHSVFQRILAQGSFDRLAHGEEEDKGGILVEIDTNKGLTKWNFLINKKSMIFKTYYINSNIDISESLNKFKKEIKLLPNNSNIRFIYDDVKDIKSILNPIVNKYKHINFKIVNKKVNNEPNKKINLDEMYNVFSITKKNIKKLILDSINSNKEYSNINKNIVNEILNKLC